MGRREAEEKVLLQEVNNKWLLYLVLSGLGVK